MAKKERPKKALELAERRRTVATLYLRRVSQWGIARELGVGQATVSRDIKALTQQWLKEGIEDIRKVKTHELAELDEMERECALQFFQTKDPGWLDRRLKCKERRARLLSLDAPMKIAPTNPEGTHAYQPVLTDDELLHRLKAILGSEGAADLGAISPELSGLPAGLSE